MEATQPAVLHDEPADERLALTQRNMWCWRLIEQPPATIAFLIFRTFQICPKDP